MKTVMVRYKTSSKKHAEENAELVRAVFAQLAERAPEGLRYASYRLEDGVTFVHLATVASPGANPLTSLPAFKAFTKEIESRCVEPPVVAEMHAVGSYGVGL